jgi:carboxyl-terminal processing protease
VIEFSIWFPGAALAVAAAMEELREVDGIVVDLRGNPGGLAALVMGIGGHFLHEPVSLGEMRTRDTTLRFVANPQRVTADGRRVEPYAGPLAILVDPLSASTTEVFAGGMQGLGRARIFGEPTAGQALPALVSALPNGDRLMHAVADFTAPDGTRLEGGGVVPDVAAPPLQSALLRGEDPALARALEWIRSASLPTP